MDPDRRSPSWRPELEEEVSEELAFHVEMRTRDLVAQGLDPKEARRRALRQFGDVQGVHDTCRRLGEQRESVMRRGRYFSELTLDARFALRQVARNPGFTLAAVLTLALGIGATTAIFSLVHAVVLNPLPIPGAERIVAVYSTWKTVERGGVSSGNFVDGVSNVTSFEAATAVRFSTFNLGAGGDAERVVGARATAGFFRVFATPPMLGRVFGADEDQPGRELVVVLSHTLWKRRFGGEPGVVGQTIHLSGRSYEVVGVMPASFDAAGRTEQLWVPMAFTVEERAQHDEHLLNTYARLTPTAAQEHAVAELQRQAEDLRRRFPDDNRERGFALASLRDEVVGDYDERLYTLFGAVGFVLLIACVNVANLLLARGVSRGRELGIRMAIGAGRSRLIRQLLTESVVLALIAAACGLSIARWGIAALIAFAPAGIPRIEEASLDGVAVIFAGAAAVLSVIVFGLMPAIKTAPANVVSALKDAAGGAGHGAIRDRVRSALIAAELALAVILLLGAGLLIRSSLALQQVDPGFTAGGVLSGRITLPDSHYSDPLRVVDTFSRMASAASVLPGVRSAAVTTSLPMSLGGNSNGLTPEGAAFDGSNSIDARLHIVTPAYFQTMGIDIVRGRGFTDADRRSTLRVMVINESLAKAAFPGGDALGRRIACCEAGPGGRGPHYKVVVGIARDVRSRGLRYESAPEFYLPIDQAPLEAWDWVQRSAYIVARTSIDPMAIVPALQAAAAGIATGVPLYDTRTMEQRIGASLATAQFNTFLFTLLGVVGLVLAAIGIYGVVAYFVSRRTPEIGVRMALGATRRDVIALVVGQAAWPTAIGISAGLALGTVGMRAISSQLFGVGAGDPLTVMLVILTLTAVALLASVIPARRAVAIDPTRALRPQ